MAIISNFDGTFLFILQQQNIVVSLYMILLGFLSSSPDNKIQCCLFAYYINVCTISIIINICLQYNLPGIGLDSFLIVSSNILLIIEDFKK